MRKVYYIYNPRTQTYDRIYPTVRQRALSILRRLFFGMGLGAGSFIVLLLIFGSPSEKELRKENSQLKAQYNVLSRRMDEAMGVLQDVQQRDDNLYRVIFQADPVPSAIRKAGYGGTNRYEHLMDMANSDLVVKLRRKWICSRNSFIFSHVRLTMWWRCARIMMRCCVAYLPSNLFRIRICVRPLPVTEHVLILFTGLPSFMQAWTFRRIRVRKFRQPVTVRW